MTSRRGAAVPLRSLQLLPPRGRQRAEREHVDSSLPTLRRARRVLAASTSCWSAPGRGTLRSGGPS